jgi:NitT/TauT family transport system permease protein
MPRSCRTPPSERSIDRAGCRLQVPLIFAGLVALAAEGIAMYWLMALLEARMTGWAHRSGFAPA